MKQYEVHEMQKQLGPSKPEEGTSFLGTLKKTEPWLITVWILFKPV